MDLHTSNTESRAGWDHISAKMALIRASHATLCGKWIPQGLALVGVTPGPDDRLELDSGGLDFVDVGEAHYPFQASIPEEVRKVALHLLTAVAQLTDGLSRRVEADASCEVFEHLW